MKPCSKCKEFKNDDEFYLRKDSLSGRTSQCKICHAKKMTLKHQKIKLHLVEKFGGECLDCGYKDEPRILQFHHRDPKLKSFQISKKCRYNIPQLEEECKKCDLLCPRCHALHHLKFYE